ncbi:IS66 family insertion sequence element accessory protein TnpB [Bradyrhizobium sp. CCBAU 65884]|uniref:IS66 family insertion sequence element accessory protein TnpB n=1 Tax=Bradyrhizobium sp. CCBAU 65884 TaxID=722477 RepID=UPI002306D115|nr:IS66 family insertion sequence element accessory protein TnpB [Bradyrhizobium sp. CCBAU 65884]
MIGPSGAVRVMVATKPVDFRKGMEGLATLVRESMGADSFSRAVYVFRAKRADQAGVLGRSGFVRGALPVHLPRIEVVIDIDHKICPYRQFQAPAIQLFLWKSITILCRTRT